MKKAFLISGFNMNQSAEDAKFKELRDDIKSKGYEVIPVPFHWNHTTVGQYVEKFIPFYEENKSDQNVVIGNSYGAMVAFLATPHIKPNKIILCSLSPYFKEDAHRTTEAYRIKKFGKRRSSAIKYLSADVTAKAVNKINTEVVMMYGEKEHVTAPFLVDRVKETAKSLKNAKLIEIPGAPHSFRAPEYIEAIVKEL